jgi:hypothetical protein
MWALALSLIITAASVLLRRTRWATTTLRLSRISYAVFLASALLYFPRKSGFQFSLPQCQWTFGFDLALHSLSNYPHIALFAVFYLLTFAQLRGVQHRGLWTFVIVMAMGLLVELGQGATAQGNCRMRDLIPDFLGVLVGAATTRILTAVSGPRGAPGS